MCVCVCVCVYACVWVVCVCKVVATGANAGMIEVVDNSKTTADIHKVSQQSISSNIGDGYTYRIHNLCSNEFLTFI